MTFVCLAEGIWPDMSERDAMLLGATALLIGVLLLGAMALYWADRWRKQQLAETGPSTSDELTSFRVLYEQGELSQSEYDRIRSRLARKLRDEAAPRQPGPVLLPEELAEQPPPGDGPGQQGSGTEVWPPRPPADDTVT
jgi:hypothetical protein